MIYSKTTKGEVFLKRIVKPSVIFLIGAVGYYSIELAARGFSHWTMGLCGGICLVRIHSINHRYKHLPLTFRAIICAFFITFVEFVAGCLLNLWLGLNIWDYSVLPYNILGQISLTFSSLWFYLSFAICGIISFVENSNKRQKA